MLKKNKRLFLCLFLLLSFNCFSQTKSNQDLPNILWIVSEDNSAIYTGCYGNTFATTPNIDKLASEGFLYTHAYCPNAVCAPSRNTILTGVYASSNGHENMRSLYPKSEIVRTYPEYLKEAGYYCTNNRKTDYNTNSVDPDKIWDECSGKAHYKNRPEGKPFFAVFNSMISHESCLFKKIIPNDELKHDPAKVTLAPYHPDTPEMRHDWAQYYDCVETMDAWVGGLLKELDNSGLADNTIVFYYGDNGGVLPRSKRFVYESGTQIPLVIRIPEKYKNLYPVTTQNNQVDRLVNFVDFVPTLLSIVGVPIPEYLQGHAFLGDQKTKDPEYTFMSRLRMDERYDNVRTVRGKQYRYIRNYMPFRISMQHVTFLFNSMSARSWAEEYEAGRTNEVQSRVFQEKPVEELYDTENDPWEIHNLANDPKYADVLKQMSKALDDWRRETYDIGIIPETDYTLLAGDMPIYDYMRSNKCPFNAIVEASDLAVMGNKKDINTYIKYLQNENSAIRYWGATGLIVLKDAAKPAIEALKKAANDESVAVSTAVAEALYQLGEKEIANKIYLRFINMDYDEISRTFVLNSIDAVDNNDLEIKEAVYKLIDNLNKEYDKTHPISEREENPWYKPQGYTGNEKKVADYLVSKWEGK
jgi:arylsulfatase A-like enzyme